MILRGKAVEDLRAGDDVEIHVDQAGGVCLVVRLGTTVKTVDPKAEKPTE